MDTELLGHEHGVATVIAFSTAGCTGIWDTGIYELSPSHMFSQCCNFTAPGKIDWLTFHQISEAKVDLSAKGMITLC